MSMSRRVAVLSCLILVMALGMVSGSTAQAQPGMTPPAASTPPAANGRPGAPAQPGATAPATPGARAQPAGMPPATPGARAQPAGMPPATSEYPPIPPPAPAGNVPVQPRGVLAPGATVPAAAPPRPAPRYETYHALAFLGDFAWFYASYRLVEAESDAAALVSLGGYVLTVPFIHAVQGNTRSAWISGGVRAAALGLTLGSIAAAFGSSCSGDSCPALGLAFTGLMGMGTIMVADWFVLSRKEIPQETPARPRGTQPGWTLLPQVQLGHESLQVGVGGAF
jgi:hypothetical protein